MNNSYRYDDVFSKYELIDMRKDYLYWLKDIDDRKVSAGIFGEGRSVIQVIAYMFDIPELKQILFTGDFRIQLQYGESKKFKYNENGAENEVSFEEFLEKLHGEIELEEESSIFEGIIDLPNDVLKSLKITAATLPEDLKDEIFLCTDICVSALSATHMLSAKERNFINHPLNMTKCYFLCDIDNVHEEERERVKSLINPYMSNGDKCYILPYDGDYNSILNDWIMTPDIRENRVMAVDAYFKTCIHSTLHERLSYAMHDKELLCKTVTDLESAESELPKYKDKTVKYVYLNYIDTIKTNTASEILKFYEQLNDNIAEGVKEERNVKELQEELPYYIAGEWTGFIENNLNVSIQKNVDMITPVIEEYVDEKTELFLKELLTEEEYENIGMIVNSAMDSERISDNKAQTVAGNMPLDKKDNITVRSVLPKCLIALGGVAVLSSLVLPGVLLVLSGFKGNNDAVEETQNELIKAGKKLNYDYFKEVQVNVEDLINRVRLSTETVVEECYMGIIDILVKMIQSYKDKIEKIDERIVLINADLEAL